MVVSTKMVAVSGSNRPSLAVAKLLRKTDPKQLIRSQHIHPAQSEHLQRGDVDDCYAQCAAAREPALSVQDRIRLDVRRRPEGGRGRRRLGEVVQAQGD